MDNKITPSHILRLYTWQLLSNNTDIESVDGMIPIVPISDEPKLVNSGKLYIVYGYAEMPEGNLNEVRDGTFSMRITSPTFAQLGEVTTTISRAFENQDMSAANVNLWSSDYQDGILIGIRFTDLQVSYIEQAEPRETEGGPISAVMNIHYCYVTHQTVKTYQPNGLWA